MNKIPWSCSETLLDAGGQYLLLKGKIGGTRVTLAAFYAPNIQQDNFLKKFLDKTMRFTEGQLIMGGDLNASLVPGEDIYSGVSAVSLGVRKRIVRSLYGARLVDTWHLFHSGERDYSFFTAPHKTYSRIDYFFTPRSIACNRGSKYWEDNLVRPCTNFYEV